LLSDPWATESSCSHCQVATTVFTATVTGVLSSAWAPKASDYCRRLHSCNLLNVVLRKTVGPKDKGNIALHLYLCVSLC
jgi:hypothetical protein